MEKIIEKGRKRTGALDSTSEKSEDRINKMFESYANSELFEHDFNKMNSTARIKFVQEMAPYFLKKPKFENIEHYDMTEKEYNWWKKDYKDFFTDVKVYRGDLKDVSENYRPF